jgi:hypothetical protein
MAALLDQSVPEAAALGTLAEVAGRFRIAHVVVQDEFSHDVLVSLPDGRALAFDAT